MGYLLSHMSIENGISRTKTAKEHRFVLELRTLGQRAGSPSSKYSTLSLSPSSSLFVRGFSRGTISLWKESILAICTRGVRCALWKVAQGENRSYV